MEEYRYYHFEEPCPYWEFAQTKHVADTLSIDVTGGELHASRDDERVASGANHFAAPLAGAAGVAGAGGAALGAAALPAVGCALPGRASIFTCT